MNIQPITLTGKVVRLEPLDVRHAPDLVSIITPDTAIYNYTVPRELTVPVFEEYIQTLNSRPNYVALAFVVIETGKAVGVTTYMDIQNHNRGVEIGSTWIGRPYQGTQVNPEAKYMMLRHAFEDQGALRVQLKTDGRNLQSQRAIEKLGAVKEGILRKHIIMPDGYIRDTVMYSITDDEWLAVKERLETRLGYTP